MVILTKKQLTIFEAFIKNPFRELTLKEIKKISKEKSNNLLTISIKQFKKQQLVIFRKIGKSSLFRLNLENPSVFPYISLVNSERIPVLAQKTIKILKDELEGYIQFYSIAIFGSYAVGEQRDNSDFDVAVFIEEEKNKKKGVAILNEAELKSILHIDGHIITQAEFFEMLKNDEENLGKQIARKHLVISNPEIFYSLLNNGLGNKLRLDLVFAKSKKRVKVI